MTVSVGVISCGSAKTMMHTVTQVMKTLGNGVEDMYLRSAPARRRRTPLLTLVHADVTVNMLLGRNTMVRSVPVGGTMKTAPVDVTCGGHVSTEVTMPSGIVRMKATTMMTNKITTREPMRMTKTSRWEGMRTKIQTLHVSVWHGNKQSGIVKMCMVNKTTMQSRVAREFEL